jgi:hypothetical protein
MLKNNCQCMRTHKFKWSINRLWILDLMKLKLLNIHSPSTEPNTWIMANLVNLTYSKMLHIYIYDQPSHFNERINSIKKGQSNSNIFFHHPLEHKFMQIQVRWAQKACWSSIQPHRPSSSLVGKIETSQYWHDYWKTHHNLQVSNSGGKQKWVPHWAHVVEIKLVAL